MYKRRIIARIDVKNEFVIKGIHLEGLRKLGDPNVFAKRYYEAGIDEIIFMDSVASLYGRNNLFHIIESACREVFIPITIGGGIRSVDDIAFALKAGADKVSVNTQAIKMPELITQAAQIYGSQCIVGVIEAKRKSGYWEAYIDNGRQETGVDAIEWAQNLEKLGAGEIMVTSIDMEGTKKGFDIELIRNISNVVSIPVIASGGAGKDDHIVEVFRNANVNAVALASMLHYNIADISQVKQKLINSNINVRI